MPGISAALHYARERELASSLRSLVQARDYETLNCTDVEPIHFQVPLPAFLKPETQTETPLTFTSLTSHLPTPSYPPPHHVHFHLQAHGHRGRRRGRPVRPVTLTLVTRHILTHRRYEGDLQTAAPHKKSGGQFGSPETTTDPSKTSEAAQHQSDRGERTAENIRYGQGISEGGMGGMTDGSVGAGGGSAEQEGYGRVNGKKEDAGAEQGRSAAGYGGERDMDREVGA